jgi:uncharacterized protein (TIGR03435 family)
MSPLVFACAAFGQAAAVPPVFEVASLKPSHGDIRDENVETSRGTLTMRSVTVNSCIKWAYGVQDSQVSGPNLLTSERYDVAAKAASTIADDQLKLMLRALLAERFKLALHRQSKEMPGYALVVAKNGPKIHESQGEGKSNLQLGRGTVVAQWTTMAQFADLISGPMQAPVLEMTGLKGKYDFSLDLSVYVEDPNRQRGQQLDMVSILIKALQEQVGLNLESRRALFDVLIVDHIEKPSEN